MRIELQSMDGQNYVITSSKPATIAQWFADMLPLMISANASMPHWAIRVWPSTDVEHEGMRGVPVPLMNAERVAQLADLFRRWSRE